ncbi:hypothetical protein CL657_00065 [bacterium]|nr:hypothetical protein [bacterium]|tara:strand:- start:4189 stop:5412 length:1224 start_codon:yes stop_codon:yes gene_type:complete
MKFFSSPLVISYLIVFLPRIILLFLAFSQLISLPISNEYLLIFQEDIKLNAYIYPGYWFYSYLLKCLTFDQPILMACLQVMITSFLGTLIYLISNIVGLSHKKRFLSVLCVALHPYILSTTIFQAQTSISITVTVWLFYVALKWVENPRIRYSIYFALVISIAFFFRSYFVLFPFVCIGLITYFKQKKFKSSNILWNSWRQITIVSITLLFFMVLTITSAKYVLSQLGRPIMPPVFGINFFIGQNNHVHIYAKKHDISTWLEDVLKHYPLPDTLTPQERDRQYLKMALTYIKENPYQALINIGYKSYRFLDYRLDDSDNVGFVKNMLYTIPYIIYFPLFLIGIRLFSRSNTLIGITMVSLLTVFFGVHILLHGGVRHRIYVDSIFIIFAFFGFDYCKAKIKSIINTK